MRYAADYLDGSKAKRVSFPNLKPSTTAVASRLPADLLERIKVAANKQDMPCLSPIKARPFEKVGQ